MNPQDKSPALQKEDIAFAGRTGNLDVDLSFSRIFAIFVKSFKSIIVTFLFLLLLSACYIFVAPKQYMVSGVVEQPDLSGNLQTADPSGLSISKTLLNQNDNDRISKYIVMIASPNIAQAVMGDPSMMRVLLGDKWVQVPNTTDWVRKFGLGYVGDNIRCALFSERCPRHLTPERVSDEISSRLSIDATVMPNQGLLGNNSTSYNISLIGPDPENLLRLLRALHDATNRAIQSHEVMIANQLLASMNQRVEHIQNTDAKQALIQVLSAQERQVAVMTASKIDYAADWVLEPTVSAWPVKPNMSLIVGFDFVLSLAIGIFIGSRGGLRKFFSRLRS